MKNLVFGLIAIVMFSFVGNAKDNIKIKCNSFNIEKNNIIPILDLTEPVIWCSTLTLVIAPGGLGGTISTRVCCGCGGGNCGCWNAGKPMGNINIDTFDQKMLDYIAKEKVTSIKIESSNYVDFDGKLVCVKAGDYKILTYNKVRYIDVELEIKSK
jgi:hypothetical protein